MSLVLLDAKVAQPGLSAEKVQEPEGEKWKQQEDEDVAQFFEGQNHQVNPKCPLIC